VQEHYRNDKVKMQVEKLLRLYPYCHFDKRGDYLMWKSESPEVYGDGLVMVNLSNIDSIDFLEDKAVLHSNREAHLVNRWGEKSYDENATSFPISFSYEIPKQVSDYSRLKYQSNEVRMQVQKLLKLYPYCHFDDSGWQLMWGGPGNVIESVLLSNIDSIDFLADKAILHCNTGTQNFGNTKVEFHKRSVGHAFLSNNEVQNRPGRIKIQDCYQSYEIKMQVQKLLKLYPYCHLDDNGEYLYWAKNRGSVIGSVHLRNIDSIQFLENKAVLHCENGTQLDGDTAVEFSEKQISFPEKFGACFFRMDS